MTFQLEWLNRVPQDEAKTSADIQTETGERLILETSACRKERREINGNEEASEDVCALYVSTSRIACPVCDIEC